MGRSPLKSAFLVCGLIAAAASAGSARADGNAATGAIYFKTRCMPCHNAARDAGAKVGPNLFGVFGRAAASAPGFNYSAAMKASHLVWTADKLKLFLANPRAVVPVTKMTFAGIRRDQDLADVIAYLATLK